MNPPCCVEGCDNILAEVAKCEVVCANCHAIRTATRREAVNAAAG